MELAEENLGHRPIPDGSDLKKDPKKKPSNNNKIESQNMGKKIKEKDQTNNKHDNGMAKVRRENTFDDEKENTPLNKEMKKRDEPEIKEFNPDEMKEADQTDNSDDEKLLDNKNLDIETRNRLYNKGIHLFLNNKRELALPYFMTCINGVLEAGKFQYFPQCLKKIAEIYYSQENYEKAIQFIQAEKLFYETALINSSGSEKQEEKPTDEKGERADVGVRPDEVRADEYAKLAKMCLDKKQSELALEYQGKATQLRQQVLGNEHPLTKESLDFFTVVYAEVGKQEYSETLKKTLIRSPKEIQGENPKKSDNGQNADRQVAPEYVSSDMETHQEGYITGTVVLVLVILCMCVLSALLLHLYCRMDISSHLCTTWKSQAYYYYMKLKYFYYTWNPDAMNKFG